MLRFLVGVPSHDFTENRELQVRLNDSHCCWSSKKVYILFKQVFDVFQGTKICHERQGHGFESLGDDGHTVVAECFADEFELYPEIALINCAKKAMTNLQCRDRVEFFEFSLEGQAG